MEEFVAEVDCHKDAYGIVILESNGKLINELEIPPTNEGYVLAISRLPSKRALRLCCVWLGMPCGRCRDAGDSTTR